jgi:hypothetical protein
MAMSLAASVFNSFVDNYDKSFARWFGTFREQLQQSSTPQSVRLARLQYDLAKLASELDVDNALGGMDKSGQIQKPKWMQPDKIGEWAQDPVPAPTPSL